MPDYTIWQWILFFFIYCFFGWCFETALVSIEEKHFVNRGFLRSPFLPIYGFGSLVMISAGQPFNDDPVAMFICGALSATLLEYITGWLMELLFKTRYWDYSDCRYNLSGRICVEATFLWGFMTLLVNYKVHVHLIKPVTDLDRTAIIIIDIILIAIFAADFIASAKSAIDVNHLLKRLTEIREELSQFNCKLKEAAENSEKHYIESISRKIQQLQNERSSASDHLNFLKKDLINAHPRARSTKFNNALTELKIKIRSKDKKKR